MNTIDFDKIRRECAERQLKDRHENDLIFKIDNMIKERADNNKYMCFEVLNSNFEYDTDDKGDQLMYARLIFARNDNFEGMLELEKYRENFTSTSSILFEQKSPYSPVCGDFIPLLSYKDLDAPECGDFIQHTSHL